MTLLEETIEDFYKNCDDSGQSEYAIPHLLYSLVLAKRPSTVVEIGSNMGLCSMAIAAGLKFNFEHKISDFLKQWKSDWHPVKTLEDVKGKLYCIDPTLQPHFERRLKKFAFQDYIEFIKDYSDRVETEKLPPIDFLFIDGNHSYKAASTDFSKYFSKVAEGGYAAIHDYFPDSPSEKSLWWGPNILTKELRRAFDFSDCLVVDTSFQGIAIFRKKIKHMDCDLYNSNLALSFLQFYSRKYKSKLARLFSNNKEQFSKS